MSITVLLLFRHYISHNITFGAPSSGGVLCSACGAFIFREQRAITHDDICRYGPLSNLRKKFWYLTL